MSSRAIATAAVLLAVPVPSLAQCVFTGPPRMLVPRDGTVDVTWQRPILLIASPLSSGSPMLSEVLADGGLQTLAVAYTPVRYPNNAFEGRTTVVPTSPLTPDASYALSWVNQNGSQLVGRFSTGPATTVPNPLPFSAVHHPYETWADSGTCADDCPPYGWGTDQLTWSTDAGDTFLWITDGTSGETIAYGVTSGERFYFPCHPDALPSSVLRGFGLVGDAGLGVDDGGLNIDGGTLTVALTFVSPSGTVAVTTATLDLRCFEASDVGCPPIPPPDGGDGPDEDAGADGGIISPPREGCFCPSFGQSGLILLALAAIAMRRPRAPRHEPHTLR